MHVDYHIVYNPKFHDKFHEASSYYKTSLFLPNMNITDEDVEKHIIPFLNQNPCIYYIDIKGHSLSEKGLEALFNLESLSIVRHSSNKIKMAL